MIARTFDRVCAVLAQLGYTDGDKVTADGRMLAGIYSELDLLTAECLRRGIWDDLSAGRAGRLRVGADLRGAPAGGCRAAAAAWRARSARVLAAMTRLWGELDGIEKSHRLSFLREPDFGFAARAHALGVRPAARGAARRRHDPR